MMPIEDLRALIAEAFPGDEVHLSSPMGDNNHFQLVVVSPRFQDKSLVERHQMIYGAVGDAMRADVHALAIKTYTPEQWQAQQGRA
ncbi:MAG: BolA family transcriptional regulator [Candidatus Lambdaproteobacteria bacterium]|nr:BolA family transcriptional regulator [Candidatus Lambdaproteobacteria bacterium]